MRKSVLTLVLTAALAVFAGNAHAFILDFESGILGAAGAYTYPAAPGTVSFNGLVDTGSITDHTLGTTDGHVWLKGDSTNRVMSFDFQVDSIEFYFKGTSSGSMTVRYYNAGDVLIGTNVASFDTANWTSLNFGTPLSTISRLEFVANSALILDDFNIEPLVPEPMSLMLFGMGSGALGFIRRKKRS